jgi:hypothetical protein
MARGNDHLLPREKPVGLYAQVHVTHDSAMTRGNQAEAIKALMKRA